MLHERPYVCTFDSGKVIGMYYNENWSCMHRFLAIYIQYTIQGCVCCVHQGCIALLLSFGIILYLMATACTSYIFEPSIQYVTYKACCGICIIICIKLDWPTLFIAITSLWIILSAYVLYYTLAKELKI